MPYRDDPAQWDICRSQPAIGVGLTADSPVQCSTPAAEPVRTRCTRRPPCTDHASIPTRHRRCTHLNQDTLELGKTSRGWQCTRAIGNTGSRRQTQGVIEIVFGRVISDARATT